MCWSAREGAGRDRKLPCNHAYMLALMIKDPWHASEGCGRPTPQQAVSLRWRPHYRYWQAKLFIVSHCS